MTDYLPSALNLARFQFAFVVVWHFLFPAVSIGLASYLAVLEGLWLRTKNPVFLDTFKYWLRAFAVVFAMGVVSGIVMSYQFGTNWSVFSDRAGPVIGPLMGYEVLTAFFLEAGFLGVMLFGLNRVGPRLHFAATCLVAGGTFMSAFWILSANSWMHTPAGFTRGPDGQFLPADWVAIIFNPSFPYRLAHTVTGAYLTTAMIVGAVGAFHLLKDKTNPRARVMFSMALWMAAIVGPAQAVIGDLHGSNTYRYQPAKVAAMEGHFETRRGAPLLLFGWPDADARRTHYEVGVPMLGSIILEHNPNGEVRGLNAFPRENWPDNLALVFWAFRVMVGLGLLIIALGAVSLLLRWRKRLYDTRWFQRWAILMGPSGLVAVTAGWIVTEAGRQPFTVYGLMRTSESLSPVAAPAVATSLAAFAIVYFIVFGAGIGYLLWLFRQTPQAHDPGVPQGEVVRTAGITPAPAVAGEAPAETGRAEPLPEEGRQP